MNIRVNKRAMAIAVLAAAAALPTAPAAGQRPALAMLDRLDRGSWELRLRDASRKTERVCFGDPRRLIQLRHPAQNCERLVINDSPSEVTVQYTCKGHGYGRTKIRRETNQLIQIDSQGFVDGMPFAFAAEGRRVGDCV